MLLGSKLEVISWNFIVWMIENYDCCWNYSGGEGRMYFLFNDTWRTITTTGSFIVLYCDGGEDFSPALWTGSVSDMVLWLCGRVEIDRIYSERGQDTSFWREWWYIGRCLEFVTSWVICILSRGKQWGCLLDNTEVDIMDVGEGRGS